MTRLLYGVCGEGLGHAIRNKIPINYLIRKNKERDKSISVKS